MQRNITGTCTPQSKSNKEFWTLLEFSCSSVCPLALLHPEGVTMYRLVYICSFGSWDVRGITILLRWSADHQIEARVAKSRNPRTEKGSYVNLVRKDLFSKFETGHIGREVSLGYSICPFALLPSACSKEITSSTSWASLQQETSGLRVILKIPVMVQYIPVVPLLLQQPTYLPTQCLSTSTSPGTQISLVNAFGLNYYYGLHPGHSLTWTQECWSTFKTSRNITQDKLQ